MGDVKPDKREKPRSHLEHIPRRSLFVEASAPDTRRLPEIASAPKSVATVTKKNVTKKRGRPAKAKPATAAERQRAARARKKAS